MAEAIVEISEPGRTPLTIVLRGSLAIGRDCDGLLVTDQQVSRRHAELRATDRGVQVTDLGSTNGTFKDDERIYGSVMLAPGDTARLGATTVEVARPPAGSGRPLGTSTTIAPVDDFRRTSIDDVSARAVRDSPALLSQEHHHGTITIVFSDIEGSTERVTQTGDATWYELLSFHHELVRRHVARFGGVEALMQGDGFMLTFASARRAVEAAAAIQVELASTAVQARSGGLKVRIGMHTGEVLVDDRGELFGQHIHLAARVGSTATGGEILVSSLTRALLEARGDLRFGEPRVVSMKGIADPQAVHPVLW